MLRRMLPILLAMILSACTLVPDSTPAPVPVCPTCQPCAVCTPIYIEITSTPAPTQPLPTETATPLPTVTSTPQPTPPSTLVPQTYLFEVHSGTPALIENFTHPELGCAWLGVGGQVLLLDGEPALNLAVVVSGTLADQPVDLIALTGLSPAYGPGGFELTIPSVPVFSQGALAIQLFDLEGIPLSEPLSLETSADCAKNLTLVNFSPASGR